MKKLVLISTLLLVNYVSAAEIAPVTMRIGVELSTSRCTSAGDISMCERSETTTETAAITLTTCNDVSDGVYVCWGAWSGKVTQNDKTFAAEILATRTHNKNGEDRYEVQATLTPTWDRTANRSSIITSAKETGLQGPVTLYNAVEIGREEEATFTQQATLSLK